MIWVQMRHGDIQKLLFDRIPSVGGKQPCHDCRRFDDEATVMGEMKVIVSGELQEGQNESNIEYLLSFEFRMSVRMQVGSFTCCDSWSGGHGETYSKVGIAYGVRGEQSCHDCRRSDEAAMMGEMKVVVSIDFQGLNESNIEYLLSFVFRMNDVRRQVGGFTRCNSWSGGHGGEENLCRINLYAASISEWNSYRKSTTWKQGDKILTKKWRKGQRPQESTRDLLWPKQARPFEKCCNL